MKFSDINALGENQRRKWGVDNYTPINIIPFTLEKIDNLTILWVEMPETIYGYCCKTTLDSLIMINSNHSKGIQNVTIAHELYHLLFENDYEWNICGKSNDENEIKANKFASSFLMPTPALYEYMDCHSIERWTIENIISCEQYFQISHISLLYRLKTEKLIDKNEFKNFSIDVSSHARILGFDTDLYKSSPENKKFYPMGQIIHLTLENKKIGKSYKDEIIKWCYESSLANQF